MGKGHDTQSQAADKNVDIVSYIIACLETATLHVRGKLICICPSLLAGCYCHCTTISRVMKKQFMSSSKEGAICIIPYHFLLSSLLFSFIFLLLYVWLRISCINNLCHLLKFELIHHSEMTQMRKFEIK